MSDWNPEVVKLGPVIPVPNSDFLELTIVQGVFPSIIRKGQYKEGDLVSWIPYDSVVPDTEQFHFLAPTKKIGEVPVRTRTLKACRKRGTYSEGIIVDAPPGFKEGDSVVDYFGLCKRVYEEELPEAENSAYVGNEKGPVAFETFKYDLEGLGKYGYAFEDGEEVIITEKVEGENCTFLYTEDRLWVRSRNHFKKNPFAEISEEVAQQFFSHWWDVPLRREQGGETLEEKLRQFPNLAIWGELYGGVKGWRYDCDIKDGKIQRKFRVFDIYNIITKKFLEWDDLVKISSQLDLETAPVLYRGPWKSDSQELRQLAEGPSTFGECVREGWTMRSDPESIHPKLGRKIVKLKGQGYKLVKG